MVIGSHCGISAKKRKTDGENSVRSGTNTAFRKAGGGCCSLFYQFRNGQCAKVRLLAAVLASAGRNGHTTRANFGAALLGRGGAIRNCPITLLGKCTNVLTVHSSASSRENYVTHDDEKLV